MRGYRDEDDDNDKERSDEPVTFEDAKGLVKSSGGALKVAVDDKTVWLPIKLIDDDSEVYDAGHEGKLVIPEWLAVEKELI